MRKLKVRRGLGSEWGRFGVGLGSVRGRFGVCPELAWGGSGEALGKFLGSYQELFESSSGGWVGEVVGRFGGLKHEQPMFKRQLAAKKACKQ